MSVGAMSLSVGRKVLNYRKLSKETFRLLKFYLFIHAFPAGLVTWQLDDFLPFRSLSYVCGDQRASRAIVYDGEEFAVSRHLYGGLRRITLVHIDRIWVDYIYNLSSRSIISAFCLVGLAFS
jgi:hypothetical protein